MKEIDTLRHHVCDVFDNGDIEGLKRLNFLLNRLAAEASFLLAVLDPPPPEPEEKLELMPYEPPQGLKGDITTEGGHKDE